MSRVQASDLPAHSRLRELESLPGTLRDRASLKGLSARIRVRLQAGKPVSRDLARLEQRARRAAQRYRQRCALVPEDIDFPAELPVVERRAEIARAIREHQVVIVCGETGSGKTTQLPKLCLQLGRGVSGLIGHTQPRRLAARSVARRIGEELDASRLVGCKVRFQDLTGADNLIKLMTDGVLLAEIQGDPDLLAYDTLILDEAHERSLNVDFLLGYLKRLLPRRPDLKLLITSATIDPHSFARHFENAPVVEVSGRTFPVEVRYRPLEGDDGSRRDLEPAVAEALDELWREGRGDTLVFLAGQRQIRDVAQALRRRQPDDVDVLPLYGRLPASQQDRIFSPNAGRRRVVLATNVAETSLTVPGIRYVVDGGEARINRYSQSSGVQRLLIEPVARSSADQRAGRCGRLGPGVCIRLYGEDDYLARPPYPTPEIQRANLAGVILQMRHLGLGEVSEFPFMDPPERRFVADGYRLLQMLGAIERSHELTPLGRELAPLPLDPRIGRIALAARERPNRHAVLVLAAGLSVPDPRELDPTRRESGGDAPPWRHPSSDFLSLCLMWNDYQRWLRESSRTGARALCRENGVSYLRMREWEAVYEQLCEVLDVAPEPQLRDVDAAYNDIHQALLTGLVDRIGLRGERYEYQGPRGRRFHLFPGSVLFKKAPPWVMTAELVRTSRVFARTNAKIRPQWVERVAPHLVAHEYSEPEWDRSRGRVTAVERVSLFGLALFSRRIHYASVDAAAARDMFIRQALVRGELDTRGQFLAHNQALAADIEALEAKARRTDLLAHEDEIFAFYDRRIPSEITHARAFEAWRRQAERQAPSLLYMAREDLLRADDALPHERDFPDAIDYDGLRLPLRYELEPGTQHDGVTVVVALRQLRQLDRAPFEWLVPGMVQDKIEALIRSLPKRLRRHFVPAPEFARACREALEFRRGRLGNALAGRLQAMTGVTVSESDFDTAKLPAYLHMNFRVLDDQGQVLGEGGDLEALRRELGAAAKRHFRELNLEAWERTDLTCWNFDDLPQRRRVASEGRVLYGYPALVAEAEGVALRLFDNPQDAAAHHPAGVRSLFLHTASEQCRYVRKEVGKRRELVLRYAMVDAGGELARELLTAAANRLFLGADPMIRTRAEFEARAERARAELVGKAMQLADDVELLLQRLSAIRRALEGGRWLSPTREDIEEQIGELVYPGFVTATPADAWSRLALYLRAVQLRLERARANPQRDVELVEALRPLVGAWRARRRASRPVEPAVAGFGWRLQELRVSLFAQELKARGPVSVKRLREEWRRIEREG